jgi:hypothetical protein
VVTYESSKDYLLQITARTIQGDVREDFSQKRKKVKGESWRKATVDEHQAGMGIPVESTG